VHFLIIKQYKVLTHLPPEVSSRSPVCGGQVAPLDESPVFHYRVREGERADVPAWLATSIFGLYVKDRSWKKVWNVSSNSV
jgi:hypothetical protein